MFSHSNGGFLFLLILVIFDLHFTSLPSVTCGLDSRGPKICRRSVKLSSHWIYRDSSLSLILSHSPLPLILFLWTLLLILYFLLQKALLLSSQFASDHPSISTDAFARCRTNQARLPLLLPHCAVLSS
jgi:hypothetical protein